MAQVYLGVGSNLGDRQKNISVAVEMLSRDPAVKVIIQSALYETEPVGGPAQGKFLNGAVHIDTAISPEGLLKVIQKIESDLGRTRAVKNGPRTIDIDILLYDGLTLDTEELTIPHPRMMEREFVLKPLRDIAPYLEIFRDGENK
jgi:2-amino-4-hydroxy-6-hydroxymethyldihydropteridine diphosphokinase